MSWPAALSPAPGWTLFEAPDQDKTGELPRVVLDQRFRLLGEIGRGGMGSVHICEDLALRSRAAVKILRSHDPDLRRRFVDEATLLANLRHPHLVQVLAVGETEEGHAYMAMEYLGQSLDRRLRRGRQLGWREVVEVARQIADALASLHRAGVIHRDVKPGNIAELRGVTGRVFVKLIDLGVAQAEDVAALQQGGEELPPRRRTKEGHVLGTPGFVPPEAGLSAPTPRFDVYGLGATIFQLCTGVTPDALDPQSMRSAKPGIDVPPELESLVARALAAIPEERIASAEEFSRLLARVRTVGNDDARTALFDGCYELIELLGIGAKAEVYRAYHRDTRRYVALKILRDEVLDDDEERARFDREARVLGALDHPSIPALIDCRTSAERQRPFIAMALRRGTRAADLGRLPGDASEVVEVGLQLASALEAMHAKGIVHRDLNRTNVLIHGLGDPRGVSASLIDLGMVELHDRFYACLEERYPTPPEARVRLGSGGLEHAEWTAPEARRGGAWTPRSDVYSLGLMLHLLLTGKRPAKDEEGMLVSPAELRPECRGPLTDAILSALQPDPEHRLSAAGLGEYLEEAAAELRGEVPDGPSPPQPMHTQVAETVDAEPTSHARRVTLVLGVAVLCLLAWIWGRSGRGYETERSRMGVPARSDEANPSVRLRDTRRTEGAADSLTGQTSVRETAAVEEPRSEPHEQDRHQVESRNARPTASIHDDAAITGRSDEDSAEAPKLRESQDAAKAPSAGAPSAQAKRLTRAAFRAKLAEHKSALDRCVRGSPSIDLRVSVSATGQASQLQIGGASALVELCLHDAFASMSFPVTRNGGSHRMTLGDEGQ